MSDTEAKVSHYELAESRLVDASAAHHMRNDLLEAHYHLNRALAHAALAIADALENQQY